MTADQTFADNSIVPLSLDDADAVSGGIQWMVLLAAYAAANLASDFAQGFVDGYGG